MPTFICLPKEIKTHIFTYCALPDLPSLARVNKECNRLIKHPSIWQRQLAVHFPLAICPPAHLSLDEYCKAIYQEEYKLRSARQRYLFTLAKERDNRTLMDPSFGLSCKDIYLGIGATTGWQLPTNVVRIAISNSNLCLLNFIYALIERTQFDKEASKYTKLDRKGYNLLHWAIICNQLATVKVLLPIYTADDNLTNSKFTPLGEAARFGQAAMVEVLISQGALVDRANRYSYACQTPLHIAASEGHDKIVTSLLAAGAKLNLVDRYRSTPLDIAVQKGHGEIVKVLLTAGAIVDLASKRGWTSLHVAVGNGHGKMVAALLAAGATVDAADDKGRTSLYIAAEKGHSETIKVLLAAGADTLNFPASFNALIIAKEKGYQEIADLIEKAQKAQRSQLSSSTKKRKALTD